MSDGLPPTTVSPAPEAVAALPAGTGPRILFLHATGQAQFEFFGAWLARQGWQVTFAHGGDAPDSDEGGIRTRRFRQRPTAQPKNDYRYILEYNAANCFGAAELMFRMRHDEGYVPDVVMAHAGWGVGLSVKQIWPGTRYVAYHEWYYSDWNWDKGRSEIPADVAKLVGDRMRNLPIAAEFDSADENWCPTAFQASRFPPILRRQIRVISDGVDCAQHCPDPAARIDFDWLRLPRGRHIVTYATRGMEPLRGFPQFLRGLARLQSQRSDFDAVILANDSVSYGTQLPKGDSWWLRMMDEVDLDHRLVHVNSMRPRQEYIRTLQSSSAHVYFTEPFVTSWSLSEALAMGCLIIGSNTAPVTEFVEDMENGIIVDMDDPEEIAEMIAWSFDTPVDAAALRATARRQMQDHHDAERIFPMKAALLRDLMAR